MADLDRMTVSQLEQESHRLQLLVGTFEKDAADTRARLGQVRSEIARRTRPAPEPRVSDHALLRRLERTYGLDVEGERKRMLTPAVAAAIKSGVSAVTIDGERYIVKGNTIVTLISSVQAAE